MMLSISFDSIWYDIVCCFSKRRICLNTACFLRNKWTLDEMNHEGSACLYLLPCLPPRFAKLNRFVQFLPTWFHSHLLRPPGQQMVPAYHVFVYNVLSPNLGTQASHLRIPPTRIPDLLFFHSADSRSEAWTFNSTSDKHVGSWNSHYIESLRFRTYDWKMFFGQSKMPPQPRSPFFPRGPTATYLLTRGSCPSPVESLTVGWLFGRALDISLRDPASAVNGEGSRLLTQQLHGAMAEQLDETS